MNKQNQSILKDKILNELSKGSKESNHLANDLESDINFVIALCNEIEKDGYLNVINLSNKTAGEKYDYSISKEGILFLNSDSYRQMWKRKRIASIILIWVIPILGIIIGTLTYFKD